ncbi:hypothetical protein ACSCBZ_44010 [Streptomyces niveiscabiei]|uniref:Uncharacterized protein n=1 Tax=Streptomyces niveiscabiei TaxID=164115 RepID=A0ABW9HM46_9ACTN|nr:hypothetical protein [Streptomyces niveiscabiei]
MGDRFQVIVDLDAGEAEAARLKERVIAWLVGEGIVVADARGYAAGPGWARAVDDDWDHEPSGGLAVHVGRGAFHSGADAPEHAVCPSCAARRALDADGWAWVSTAIETWSEAGTATLTCPSCTRTAPLPDWRWDNAPFAFGHLGLKFWDWPDLSDAFRARMADVLEGHRTAYLWGKI